MPLNATLTKQQWVEETIGEGHNAIMTISIIQYAMFGVPVLKTTLFKKIWLKKALYYTCQKRLYVVKFNTGRRMSCFW